MGGRYSQALGPDSGFHTQGFRNTPNLSIRVVGLRAMNMAPL